MNIDNLFDKEEKSETALRTIGEVSEMLDIPHHVLRFWESKFKQINPLKSNGRRYYTKEDIALISQIKTLLYQEGYTIKGVQNFLALNNKKTSEPLPFEQQEFNITEDDKASLETILDNLKHLKEKLEEV